MKRPLRCTLFLLWMFWQSFSFSHVKKNHTLFSCSAAHPFRSLITSLRLSSPTLQATHSDGQATAACSCQELLASRTMLLKNILIGMAIKQDKSKQRSSSESQIEENTVLHEASLPWECGIFKWDVSLVPLPEISARKIFGNMYD